MEQVWSWAGPFTPHITWNYSDCPELLAGLGVLGEGWSIQMTIETIGLLQPRKILLDFFFFLFTLTHIPRSLGSEYHQAANLPYHLSSSSLSYNCFFYWSHMCWEIYMWISFPSILPRKVGIFLSLSLLFPRGNLWLERLCNFPGHLTSEWEDQTLDLCPSDSIIGTSNHSPKLCLWMTRSQSAGVSWG